MIAAPDQLERAALVVDDSVAVPAVATAAVTQQLASSLDADDFRDAAAGLHWTVLPDLFAPNYTVMRKQSAVGCTVVSSIIVACVGATHAAVSFGELSDPLPTVFITAIWAETTIALVCLFGLLFGDPGVIKRSEERCTPVPTGLIRTTLLAGKTLESAGIKSNYTDAVLGTYCVRCLVWRQGNEKAHHCSTCQRCVHDFDHHCGVFGRCIAGQGFGGNMGYFKVIIATGCFGVMTAISCVVLAASKYFGWQQVGWWVLLFIGIYAAIGCSCGVMNECMRRRRYNQMRQQRRVQAAAQTSLQPLTSN